MIRFPARPDSINFDANATLNEVRDEVRRIYEEKLEGFETDADRIEFPKKVLNDKNTDRWASFKDDFAAAQHGRCGYCELPVIGSQFGDVEHYRPKGMLQILDPDNQGREKADLSNVAGRKAIRTIGTGYWWDAYSWDNYLLSCAICNQSWKKNFFPVAGEPLQRSRPVEGSNEDELLIHPFGNDDPADHLFYEIDGRIRGLTEKGIATIETVGLWRPSLVSKRRTVLISLMRLISEMASPTASPDLVRSHAQTILERGSHEWPIFPGMTRIFFSQISNMSWGELEELADL